MKFSRGAQFMLRFCKCFVTLMELTLTSNINHQSYPQYFHERCSHLRYISGDVKPNDDVAETVDYFMLKQAKLIQKMVQEMDFKYTFVEGGANDQESQIEEEEIPPLPEEFLVERELTEEEKEANTIYETATAMLNKTRPDKKQAYILLEEAAGKGNMDAKALVAWGRLFGNPMKQNVEEAKQMFSSLAEEGHPDGHMGLGKYIYFL